MGLSTLGAFWKRKKIWVVDSGEHIASETGGITCIEGRKIQPCGDV
jgi:hypothetical protein